jgi:hypothetical protein
LELTQLGLLAGFLRAFGLGRIELFLGRPVVASTTEGEEPETEQDNDSNYSPWT